MTLLPSATGQGDRELGTVDAGELQTAPERLYSLANAEQAIALLRATLWQATAIIFQHQLQLLAAGPGREW